MSDLPNKSVFSSFLYAGQTVSEERYKRFERLTEIFTWAALILGVIIVQLPFAENLNENPIYILIGVTAASSIIWYHLLPKKLSGRKRSFLYGLVTTIFTAYLVHITGGSQSYLIFLYFLISLRVGMTIPLAYTLVTVFFISTLIFAEAFFTAGSLNTNLSLALLHTVGLSLVVFLGRFYAGEALLNKEKEEKTILEKEKTLGKLKDEFVFVISKELKQPTIAIKGYIDKIFSEYISELNRESKELLELTGANANRLSSLLDDLLDVSKIEKEGLKVEVRDVVLAPIVSEVLSNQFFDAKTKRISISEQGDLDVAVNADQDRLKEVLTNLVSNAIKYTPEGGKVVLTVKNEGEFAKVSVADNGFGISDEDQKHLFEKFYRVENERTKSVKGSGLGLFITKNLIEKMGGEITVQSKLGQGTAFSFKLPRYRW